VLPPSGSIDGISIDRDTAVVLMTHNFPLDTKLVPQLLPLQPRYLGLLGPRKRTTRLFEEIGEDPRRYDLHAPIGLDIGGDTPEAIALSIVAEIQSELAGRAGGPLRWNRGPIHNPVPEIGQASDLQALQTSIAVCETVHG
jgi:xanthine/CO dehydrogenase XdhC/CoxF family maturation factor